MREPDRYAVVGHPVAHSLSPRIHAAFAERTGEALVYGAVEAPLDDFVGTVRHLFEAGHRGLNVTVPFKGEAHDLADRLDPAAARAGAVNTLRREVDGTVSGFNTDGTGLVRDLEACLGGPLAGLEVVLVGAGGAAAGVVAPLLDAGVASVVVGNRTAVRAEALAARFAPAPVRAVALDDLPAAAVVVNATAAGLDGGVPPIPAAAVARARLAYDMIYAPDDAGTAFTRWARDAGAAAVADGLGMLIEQAAAAFELWRGVRPDTDGLRSALRVPTSPVSA
jgi:shikimate dehydrogenase